MADGRHSTARPPPPRVLLVESETPARKAITTEVLSGLGLRVAEAASAEAALWAAGANPEPPPAVLVTSTNFLAGRMDGLTLARKARRRWPDLGVIYVTDRPSRLDGHILGARDRFLPRPIAPVTLARAVRGLLAAPPRRAA